jgi:formyltetrahydrofolate deformylase
MTSSDHAILRIHCDDQPGIIAAVTQFVHQHGGNIVDLDQHTDSTRDKFYMRISWEMDRFDLSHEEVQYQIENSLAASYNFNWKLNFTSQPMRLALFVSKQLHCLYDILGRWQTKEWAVEIPLIISNHEDARDVAEKFDIEYKYLPITKENKLGQEKVQRELLTQYNIDLVILARYMQILSGDFIDAWRNNIINIHHSFLPAFPGARPYHSAFERGVKIIGATSHYVTEDLDEGPIIEQDIVRVTHRDDVEDLVRKGRDLETLVLSRAVWKHIQRKTLVTDNRTIIFN